MLRKKKKKRHAMNQEVLDQGVKIIGGEMHACKIWLRMKGIVIKCSPWLKAEKWNTHTHTYTYTQIKKILRKWWLKWELEHLIDCTNPQVPNLRKEVSSGLLKVRVRKTRDLNQVKCIMNKGSKVLVRERDITEKWKS